MSTKKTDGRLDPNAKAVGQPLACQLDIVPIFPVRFSMSSKTLNNAAKTGSVPPMPTGISDKEYDLRRLRQGYLYILARAKHVGNATDEKRRWLIFEYTVAKDDSNAPKLNGSGVSPYHFTQYVWTDGTARGEWKKLPRSFPYAYAYVHAQVGSIECAYSEVRWAPEMFEELERDPKKREQIMQKISLTGGTSEFIFPGALLTEKVADFKAEKLVQDLADSFRRATGLGYNKQHQVFDSCSAKKTVVIALFDRIGDIKDVSAYHQRILANNLKEFSNILYPVTTAKAIEQIEQHVFKNPNWFKRLMSSDPLDKGMREQIKIYAKKSPLMAEQTMKNLAVAQFNLLNQVGNGTPHEHMKFLDGLCKTNQQQLDKLASIADYAMAFYGTAMAGFGDTPKGMEYQKNTLVTGSSWGDSLSNLLSVGDKLNQITKETAAKLTVKALRFEVMIESVMAAQMLLWKEGVKEAIPYSRFLAAAGLKLQTISHAHVGSINVGADIVNKQMHTLIHNADELFKGLNAAHYQAELTKGVRAGTSHYINMNVHVVVKNEYNPALRVVNITESVGTFFAGGALIVNLREWAKYKEDNSGSLSAWFLHPAVRLANDFAALVASFERSRGFGTKALGTFYNRLDKAAVKQIQALTGFKEPIGIKAAAGRGTQIAKHLTLQNAGRFANVLGVVIALAQAQQAVRTGDTAARNSAILAGMAEISFFISTFAYTGAFVGIGVVLAIGSVLTSLVADNEFEKWVRTGFWGNSGDYWGKRRPEFSQRIIDAETLSISDGSNAFTRMKTFFEQEMDGFYNLVWSIGIDTSLANQYQLKVYCPAFKDKSSIDKLIVKISIEDYDNIDPMMGGGVPAPISIPTNKVRKQFLSQGEILIDMTQINILKSYHYIKNTKGSNMLNTLTVTIKHPKLGEDVSTWWRKTHADYFESQITYSGVK
jgi:hypothetical protein